MGSKSDVVMKLILVFFISLLSFAIGTYVGKKYSDNQHKLASLEPQKSHGGRSVASADNSHGEGKSETLSDDEIKKLAEEFVADDNEEHKDAATESAHGETSHGETATTAKENHATAETSVKTAEAEGAKDHGPSHDSTKNHGAAHAAKAEKSMAANATESAHQMLDGKNPNLPQEPKNQMRQPTSLPKNVGQYSVGKFTVQIAAFGTEDEARRRANELKEKGYSAFYVPAEVKGKTWYRVSVGLFATEKEAKEYKTEFVGKTKIDTVIIQKIVN